MVNLELMSENLILIIKQMLASQTLCKYVYYNTTDPLAQPDIADTTILMEDHLLPYPFDQSSTATSKCEVRVYYSRGNIEDGIIEDLQIYFDVIVSKDLWLSDGKKIRPYVIMNEIIKCFPRDISVSTLGRLKFGTFRHLTVNEHFDAIQMTASFWQIANGVTHG